jgi:hypothetical protein
MKTGVYDSVFIIAKSQALDVCRDYSRFLVELRRTYWLIGRHKITKTCPFITPKRPSFVVRILSENRAGRPDRFHRMDAGWSPEAFEVCGAEK